MSSGKLFLSHQSKRHGHKKAHEDTKSEPPFGTFMLFCGHVPVGVSDFDEVLEIKHREQVDLIQAVV